MITVEELVKRKQRFLTLEAEKSFPDREVTKKKIMHVIRERMLQKFRIEDIHDRRMFDEIVKEIWAMIEEECKSLSSELYFDTHEISEVLEYMIQTMFGYGVLDALIKDPSINEIMVNGTDHIFIEKHGEIVRAYNKKKNPLQFQSAEELLYVIDKIIAPINRKVDESNPIVDARLPNGYRVNIALDVVSLDGTVITIRKFPDNPYTMEQLISNGAISKRAAEYLIILVKNKYNIFISGGTGTGKTTFLNALSNHIGKTERLITIEDSAELKIKGVENLIRLETRPHNVEGKGEITTRELLRSALRMRPDRIVVGEVRGGEALDMLSAMNTGHDGSLSTGHANSAQDMLTRLETMVMMAGFGLPVNAIRQQISSAVDIIVHLGRWSDGRRQVLQICEMIGINEDGCIMQALFQMDIESKRKSPTLRWTGKRLKNRSKVKRNQASCEGKLEEEKIQSPPRIEENYEMQALPWRKKVKDILSTCPSILEYHSSHQTSMGTLQRHLSCVLRKDFVEIYE